MKDYFINSHNAYFQSRIFNSSLPGLTPLHVSHKLKYKLLWEFLTLKMYIHVRGFHIVIHKHRFRIPMGIC